MQSPIANKKLKITPFGFHGDTSFQCEWILARFSHRCVHRDAHRQNGGKCALAKVNKNSTICRQSPMN